jgi:protein phosphatase methylesterase 1
MDNMSDLQKSFVKSRLAKLPPDIPLFEDEEEQSNHESLTDGKKISSIAEEDGDSSSGSSTGTVVPSPSQRLFARPSS